MLCVEFPQVQCDLSELIHVLKAVGHDEKWKLKLFGQSSVLNFWSVIFLLLSHLCLSWLMKCHSKPEKMFTKGMITAWIQKLILVLIHFPTRRT